MAKDNKGNKYKISYKDLRTKLSKEKIGNNIFIFTPEKILLNEIISLIGEKFIGKTFNEKEHVRKFYSDDKNVEEFITTCSNLGFFSEKKIVLYKIFKRPGVRGFSKDEKPAILNYLGENNPDTFLIFLVQDREYNFSNFEDLEPKGVKFFAISEATEAETLEWVKEKFDDYKIDDETIIYLMKFLNFSFDEIFTEIEKLKSYCFNSKIITKESVNLCIGLSKDFSENDFIEAVLSRNANKALQIYDKLTLKEDIDIRLLAFLTSAFIAIAKLFDPEVNILVGYNLKRELRIWGDRGDNLVEIYKKYKSATNELKIMKAFDYIYKADKAFKTSAVDKKSVFSVLINNLTKI